MEKGITIRSETHGAAAQSSLNVAASLTLAVALCDCDALLQQVQRLPPISAKCSVLARAKKLKRNVEAAQAILSRADIQPAQG